MKKSNRLPTWVIWMIFSIGCRAIQTGVKLEDIVKRAQEERDSWGDDT